jgi:hypothetical protein
MSAFLAGMIRAAKQAPRHLITDRGTQFTARSFRRGCRRAGIRQRFGAIGEHGSIALVERCIRTLKEEGVRRWLAPIRWRTLGQKLSLFADWYNGQRPHAGLAGATPDEIYFGRPPAHHRPRFEPGRDGRAPRAAPGRRRPCAGGLRAGICGSFPAEIAVCARAAQHAARRAIPVAVLTLGPISPH